MNPLSDPVNLLPPLVAAVLNLIMAVVARLHGSAPPVRRVFTLFLSILAVVSVLVFAMRSTTDPRQALAWDQAVLAASFWTVPAWYLFCVRYANSRTAPLLWPAVLLAAAASMLSFGGLLVKDVRMGEFGWRSDWAPAMYGVTALGVAVVLAGAWELRVLYGGARSYHERNRMLYVFLGVGVLVTGVTIDLADVAYPAGMFALMLFGALTTAAMVRYNLLDIRAIARRGLFYALVAIGLGTPYVGLVVVVRQVLADRHAPTYTWVAAFAALGVVLLGLWQGARKVVNRWFYGGRYEDVVALERFLLESKSVTDLPRLVETLVHLVSRALRARETHFVLLSDEGFALVSSSANLRHLTRLGQESALVQWLENKGEMLTRRGVATSHDLRGLTMSDFRFLEETKGELYVPLKSEGKLVAILVLGPSLAPAGYSQHDLSLVSLAASRLATTIHDAYLFAEQKTMAEEMARLSQLKSDFVGIVAHEFKTPLTAIKAAAGMLADDSVQQSESLKRRLLVSLNTSVGRLDKLVKDSLKLASIQAAATELELENVDVRQLVDETVMSLSPLARARSQVVWVGEPRRLPSATLDAGRFQEVLSNLLDNAIKYSPEGARITIALQDRRHAFVVEVGDEAPQIPEREREAIFNPYYRIKRNGARVEGSGLGLAIAKGQMELLGGRIWVELAGAKGNRFCFSLPYRPPLAPPASRTEIVKGGNHESAGH